MHLSAIAIFPISVTQIVKFLIREFVANWTANQILESDFIWKPPTYEAS
jgi:hypothetical protein